jgi:hypothetical protein
MKELSREEMKIVNGGTTLSGLAIFRIGIEPTPGGGSSANDYVFSGYTGLLSQPVLLST